MQTMFSNTTVFKCRTLPHYDHIRNKRKQMSSSYKDQIQKVQEMHPSLVIHLETLQIQLFIWAYRLSRVKSMKPISLSAELWAACCHLLERVIRYPIHQHEPYIQYSVCVCLISLSVLTWWWQNSVKMLFQLPTLISAPVPFFFPFGSLFL